MPLLAMQEAGFTKELSLRLEQMESQLKAKVTEKPHEIAHTLEQTSNAISSEAPQADFERQMVSMLNKMHNSLLDAASQAQAAQAVQAVQADPNPDGEKPLVSDSLSGAQQKSLTQCSDQTSKQISVLLATRQTLQREPKVPVAPEKAAHRRPQSAQARSSRFESSGRHKDDLRAGRRASTGPDIMKSIELEKVQGLQRKVQLGVSSPRIFKKSSVEGDEKSKKALKVPSRPNTATGLREKKTTSKAPKSGSRLMLLARPTVLGLPYRHPGRERYDWQGINSELTRYMEERLGNLLEPPIEGHHLRDNIRAVKQKSKENRKKKLEELSKEFSMDHDDQMIARSKSSVDSRMISPVSAVRAGGVNSREVIDRITSASSAGLSRTASRTPSDLGIGRVSSNAGSVSEIGKAASSSRSPTGVRSPAAKSPVQAVGPRLKKVPGDYSVYRPEFSRTSSAENKQEQEVEVPRVLRSSVVVELLRTANYLNRV